MTPDKAALMALAEQKARTECERQGFIYWGGGPEAPTDWDGGPYLCRDGQTYHLRGYDWQHGAYCWNPTASWDRIGYRARAGADQ